MHTSLIDDKDIFIIYADIEWVSTSEKSYYEACPECRKKVSMDLSSGKYPCMKCDKVFDKPNYVYIMNMKITDGNIPRDGPAGLLYATCLGEKAEEFVGGMKCGKYITLT